MVEPHFGAQGGHGIGAGIDAEHEAGRIARYHLDRRENDKAGGKQAEDERDEPPRGVNCHKPLLLPFAPMLAKGRAAFQR